MNCRTHAERARCILLPDDAYLVWLALIPIILHLECRSASFLFDVTDNFDFSQKKAVGVCVLSDGPGGNPNTVLNVIALDLISRRYQVSLIDTSILGPKILTSTWLSDSEFLDALAARSKLSPTGLLAFVRIHWDSVFVLTNPPLGYYVPNFTGHYVIIDVATRKPILSRLCSDTCRLYSEIENQSHVVCEFPWMPVSRQTKKVFDALPNCQLASGRESAVSIPIHFYVDQSYRGRYPTEWQSRLQRRLRYVSDLFSMHFGMEFVLAGFHEWNRRFDHALYNSLRSLDSLPASEPPGVLIGVTVDSTLTRLTRSRTKLGLAEYLGSHVVVSAKPSLPGVGDWNYIEESLILAHELGHIFGAVHTLDAQSIMFREYGELLIKCDSTNRSIIRSTITYPDSFNSVRRHQRYVEVLLSLWAQGKADSIEIIPPLTEAIRQLCLLDEGMKKIDVVSAVAHFVGDSVMQNAVLGCIAYRKDMLGTAKKCFQKAIAGKPDFSEVHAYLGSIYQAQGNLSRALKHQTLAGPWRMEEPFVFR